MHAQHLHVSTFLKHYHNFNEIIKKKNSESRGNYLKLKKKKKPLKNVHFRHYFVHNITIILFLK